MLANALKTGEATLGVLFESPAPEVESSLLVKKKQQGAYAIVVTVGKPIVSKVLKEREGENHICNI